MKKICLLTCYDQPDYIRAKTLRTALGQMPGVELIIIKNRYRGWLRYPEVMAKLLFTRLKHRPDLYFLTFRGYEILPFVRLATLGKPLVFDEFINLIEWAVYEHYKLQPGSLEAKLLWGVYRVWLRTTNLITTDTTSHASYSAKLMRLPIDKYIPLIVSTDEQTFDGVVGVTKLTTEPFNVFYYGSMLPLQGLTTIIAAMRILKGQDVKLTLVGGKAKVAALVERAQRDGLVIDYQAWAPFAKLPGYMQAADICLAGPFGDTVQAQFVIGGKTYQFLRMGRPVIIGRNQESGLWTDKKDALIVEQANPRALAEAILWARHHPAELAKIGQAGKDLYEQKLSNRVLVNQLERLLANKRLF